MKSIVIYVHGKGGNAAEAEHYRSLFSTSDVIGFDYKSETPWDAVKEFPAFFEGARKNYDKVTLIANSIGAFFSLNSLNTDLIDNAFLISPVVDMEKLISNMMLWAGVTEEELEKRKEIPTNFGETLSWKYLSYVREHPIKWNVPTKILYGENDNLTSIDTITDFANRFGAKLTVFKNGEHWFHTDEQMKFLDEWIKKNI